MYARARHHLNRMEAEPSLWFNLIIAWPSLCYGFTSSSSTAGTAVAMWYHLGVQFEV